jgi:hypothetical protein
VSIAYFVCPTHGRATDFALRSSAMFLIISNFARVERAALCAARVTVSAAVDCCEAVIWGVSDPLCHPPITFPRPVFGGRSRLRSMSLLSGKTALCPCHRRVRCQCRTYRRRHTL